MKFLITIALLFASISIFSQNSLGVFKYAADIGKPKNAGSSTYDPKTKTYNLKGSGYNIWFNRDEFHYLYNKMQGNFVLTANFQFVGDTGNAHPVIASPSRLGTRSFNRPSRSPSYGSAPAR